MLASGYVNARDGHPPQDHWHQLLWCEAAGRVRLGRVRADVLQSAKVRPPDLSSSPARARAGRRGINSGMENNSVLRRFLVCALAALSVAGAWRTASPAARAQDAPKEEKPKKQEAPKPAKP